MKTFQEYLATQVTNDHLIRATTFKGVSQFYIHPTASGDTLNFAVIGNTCFNFETDGSIVNLSFGQAMELITAGKQVTRDAWHYPECWIDMEHPGARYSMTVPHLCMSYKSFALNPARRIPWTPNQEDLLAKDWRLLNTPLCI